MGRRKLKPDMKKLSGVINPLTSVDFKVIIRTIVDSKKFVMVNGIQVPAVTEYEYDEYAKLFVGSENRRIVGLLNSCAKELLLWLFFEVESGEDLVWINKVRYMDENNISSVNTYKKGLNDLIDRGIICPSSIGGVYWINPRLFFNGNRARKYPNNVEEYKAKKEKE